MSESPTAALPALATELLFIIGSYLRDDELVGISAASTRFRQIFLHRRYAMIEFSGSVKHIAGCLITLHSEDADNISVDMKKLIRTFTRFVTIRIHYPPHTNNLPLRFARNDLDHFGILLRSIDRLCGVNISLSFPRPRDCISFNKALRNAAWWSYCTNKPLSLTFLDDPADTNFNAIFRHFDPASLAAVQLPGGLNRKHYTKLKSYVHAYALKTLHVDRTVNNQQTRHVVPSLDQDFLREVRKDFPQLESLILHEDTPGLTIYSDLRCWPFGLVWFNDKSALDRNIRRMVRQLQRMPCLRRFAFTLWFVRLHGHLIPHDWEDYEGTYRHKTMVEMDKFYIDKIVTVIMTRVPALEELCVSSNHPTFYRGTRRDGQIHVERESRHNLGEEKRFPSLLLDLK
ncbi:hypothetical protein FPANT_11476 [Fusarium pseudoanthophilum]|uniref:F-box domain-containing protein n=1 Tax=Fusarium pseudoanthophilum TaxID=48495 RepID=A0A8H5KLS9_9HYPO|nr:hypothetical protein FPANT_11476 [Fusarium pseudoanthophilum]